MGLLSASGAIAAVAASLASGGKPAASFQGNQGELLTPRIGVIFDGRAVLQDRDQEEEEATVNELEFSFAADVDPFLKAEAYIALANEDGESVVEVEEAFGRYDNLSRGLSGKFGKIAAAMGRTNRNHADQLSYLDYPLAVQSHLGEEGLRGVGGSLSYLFPTERFLDFTLEAVVPEDGPVFMGARSSNPVWVGHLRTFFDFSDDLSAQLGGSVAHGPSLDGSASVYGLDYTMKFQPGSGRGWIFETEAFWADAIASGMPRTHGWFAALTTELRPRLFATAKYDFAKMPGSGEDVEAWSANLTLKVTEFHHWRLEFTSFDPEFGPRNERVTLQFQWGIGSHPAHKY